MVLGWVCITAAMALVLFLFMVYFNYRKGNMENLKPENKHHKVEVVDSDDHTVKMQQFEIEYTDKHHEPRSYEMKDHHDDQYEDTYAEEDHHYESGANRES
jgi:hypothetical protein